MEEEGPVPLPTDQPRGDLHSDAVFAHNQALTRAKEHKEFLLAFVDWGNPIMVQEKERRETELEALIKAFGLGRAFMAHPRGWSGGGGHINMSQQGLLLVVGLLSPSLFFFERFFLFLSPFPVSSGPLLLCSFF